MVPRGVPPGSGDEDGDGGHGGGGDGDDNDGSAAVVSSRVGRTSRGDTVLVSSSGDGIASHGSVVVVISVESEVIEILLTLTAQWSRRPVAAAAACVIPSGSKGET